MTWHRIVSRAFDPWNRWVVDDIVLNVALFVPVGFLSLRWLAERLPAWRAVMLSLLLGISFSSTVEYLQLYFSRETSLGDVIANSVGTAVGIAAGLYTLRHALQGWANRFFRRPELAMLLVVWFTSQLYPLIPSLRRPHINWFTRSWPEELAVVLLMVVEIMALGAMVRAVTGGHRSGTLLLLAAVVAIGVRTVIAGRSLGAAEGVGASIGLVMAWFAPRLPVVAALLACAVLCAGLAPFHFLQSPNQFDWWPFEAVLSSPWEGGVPLLMGKMFRYSALIWLLHQTGWRWRTAALATAVLLGGIEWAQVWLPGRSSEITDPLLALIAGYILWELTNFEEGPSRPSFIKAG